MSGAGWGSDLFSSGCLGRVKLQRRVIGRTQRLAVKPRFDDELHAAIAVGLQKSIHGAWRYPATMASCWVQNWIRFSTGARLYSAVPTKVLAKKSPTCL